MHNNIILIYTIDAYIMHTNIRLNLRKCEHLHEEEVGVVRLSEELLEHISLRGGGGGAGAALR